MICLSEPLIEDVDISAVVKVLESGWLTQGPQVQEFEDAFARYVSAPYAVAVNSATSGLHLALLALGVGPGDEVIVPAFTWVATANAVELCGGKPVFIDIEFRKFNTSTPQILEKITPRTKAIIPVHLFGKPFNVRGLSKKLPRFIPILEDAACALGAQINEEFCGTLGDLGVFSFHPRKSITTGEGGMVCTSDEKRYKKICRLKNHGQDTSATLENKGEMLDCPTYGFNYRMPDILAALGTTQLKRIDHFIDGRKQLAAIYNDALSDESDITLPSEEPYERHAWQAYVILLNSDKVSRRVLMLSLQNAGIETRPGTHAIHLLTYYKDKYKLAAEDFPNSFWAYKHSIALPLHNKMSKKDCLFVANALKGCIRAEK